MRSLFTTEPYMERMATSGRQGGEQQEGQGDRLERRRACVCAARDGVAATLPSLVSRFVKDDALTPLIEGSDLAGMLRHIDGICERREWDELVELRGVFWHRNGALGSRRFRLI